MIIFPRQPKMYTNGGWVSVLLRLPVSPLALTMKRFKQEFFDMFVRKASFYTEFIWYGQTP